MNYITPSTEMKDQYSLALNPTSIELLHDAIESHARPEDTSQPNNKKSKTNEKKRSNGKSKKDVEDAAQPAPKRAGRKPLDKVPSAAESDPKQKRKAQNRAAQRAFRERKERHVTDLEDKIKELEDKTKLHDEQLLRENEELKAKIKALQDENYALKDARFTFSYPQPGLGDEKLTYPVQSMFNSYGGGVSGSSIGSSGEDGTSSTEHSPQSNSHDDLSSSADTPGSADHMHSFELSMIPDQLISTADPTLPSSLTLPEDTMPSKPQYATDYRDPSSLDDFLLDDTLPTLFGSDLDLFGLTAHAPLDGDVGHVAQPYSTNHDDVVARIMQAKDQGATPQQIKEELRKCGDLDIDDLCSELKKKATCDVYKFTAEDVSLVFDCYKRKQQF